MRNILTLIVTIMVALMAGQAAAVDQAVATAPFIAGQGDLWAASIMEQAITMNRLTVTATGFITGQGDLWATVNFSFAPLDVQTEWHNAGTPAFIDGVEAYLFAIANLPNGTTPVYYATPNASGKPVWKVVSNWGNSWLSLPHVYKPYLTALPPPPHLIAGQSGSVTVLIAPKQVLDVLPESPMVGGSVDYNYGVYIHFDPIDVALNFPADGILTPGADGLIKDQLLMLFCRKINGQIQMYIAP